MEFKVLFRSKIFTEIKISLKTKNNVESWIDFRTKEGHQWKNPRIPNEVYS